jgi:Ca2+-binding EF-hand superfamily protein
MMNEEEDDIPTDEEIREYFDKFDKDLNGVVDADELLYWYASINKPITIEVAKQIISIIDSNGDGKASFDEFRNAYEIITSFF